MTENRQCRKKNCKKRHNFAFKNDPVSLYCSEHKKDGMININSKKCKGCGTVTPTFNLPNHKECIYCVKCKKDNMINVKDERCIDCDKIPGFNFESEKKGIYCNDHKKKGMINIKNRGRKRKSDLEKDYKREKETIIDSEIVTDTELEKELKRILKRQEKEEEKEYYKILEEINYKDDYNSKKIKHCRFRTIF